MAFSQHQQQLNPGRGIVRRAEHPQGRLINAQTGVEIRGWLWADLDANQACAHRFDANGLEVITPDGKAVETQIINAPLAFEAHPLPPERHTPPAAPAVNEPAPIPEPPHAN